MSSTEVHGETGSTPPVEESTSPSTSSRLRRLAPLVLLAGAAVAGMFFLPHLPREHQVELRLEDPSSIVAVNVDWSAAPEQGATSSERAGEPLQGSSWRFAAGTAPRSLATMVRLPDGAYEMDIRIDRVDRVQSVHRSLTLGGADRITVPVR